MIKEINIKESEDNVKNDMVKNFKMFMNNDKSVEVVDHLAEFDKIPFKNDDTNIIYEEQPKKNDFFKGFKTTKNIMKEEYHKMKKEFDGKLKEKKKEMKKEIKNEKREFKKAKENLNPQNNQGFFNQVLDKFTNLKTFGGKQESKQSEPEKPSTCNICFNDLQKSCIDCE